MALHDEFAQSFSPKVEDLPTLTTTKLIWMGFSLAIFGYAVFLYSQNTNSEWFLYALLGGIGLITAYLLEYLIRASLRFSGVDKNSDLIVQTIEDLLLVIFVTITVFISGNLQSPFFFALILPILNSSAHHIITKPLTIALMEIVFLLLLVTGSSSNILSALTQDPIRYFIALTTLLLVGLLSHNKKQQEVVTIQKEEVFEQKSDSIRHEMEYYQVLFQNLQEGLVVTNPEGIIRLVNRKAAQYLSEGSPEQIVGKELRTILPPEFKFSNTQESEIKRVNSIGKELLLNLKPTPVLSQGTILGTIYTVQDITQKSEFEKLKLDFVAQAAHQLRTPLTVLRSYLDVLASTIRPKINTEEQDYLDKSIIGGNQLAALIENLLTVSSIENKTLPLQLAPVSIETLIESALKNMNKLFLEKKVTPLFQKPEIQLPACLIDPNLISQVLTNLLSNAVEASPENSQVNISLQLQGNMVIVTIMDQGKGLSTETSQNLFAKFYKVQGGELTQQSKGIGLGLYNSKGIIEAHKGTIWVNSILGRGSSFSFTLPTTGASSKN